MVISATAPTISFSSSSIFLNSPPQTRHPFFPNTQISKPFPSLSKTQITQRKNTLIYSQLTTLPIFTFNGERTGETFLDLKQAPPNTARAVVHRGIITDQQNQRRGTASTLTRGEVRGGGRKPYPQKKTGRARRGSTRTPLRPGGGVVFGPKPKDWSIKINRKEKRLALSTAIMSASVNTIVVEDFFDRFEKPKTKEFIAAMKRWGVDPKEKCMLFCTEVSDNVVLSSRNIGTFKVITPRSLNLFDVLNSDKLIFTKSAVDYLNSMYGMSSGEGEEDDGSEEEEDEGGEGDETSNSN